MDTARSPRRGVRQRKANPEKTNCMEYYEAANVLFDLNRYPSRKGTAATSALLGAFGDPHDELTCIQIAGSNGKGSTARMVERVLREAGLSVGLYTSPHLSDVRERIRIDGRPIRKAAVTSFVEQAHDHILTAASDGNAPTFFETLTALALFEFDRQDVDVAVLEVGIGGKHDATSVVDPVASAVTAVTLEHTDILGDTREAIARDKAHVAGENPLVTAVTDDVQSAITDVAGSVIAVGGPDSNGTVSVEHRGRDGLRSTVTIAGPSWTITPNLSLLGAHQARNAGIASVLCKQVADISTETLVRGLEAAHWPGRFEVVSQNPLVVLDGAHNPGGAETTAETLSSFDYDDCHLIYGAMSEKDHAGTLAALPTATSVIACEPATERAEDADVLVRAVERTTESDATVVRSVRSAVETALERAAENDCVLITGSLYTVAEARDRWTATPTVAQPETLDDAKSLLRERDVTREGVWRMRAKGVHRAVSLRVLGRQARFLKEELLSLGGECSITGLSSHTHEPRYLNVVLLGTLFQFKRLIGKLESQPHGLDHLGTDLRQALSIQTESPNHGYPWEDGVAVMGIINVTPDSFHDGGEYDSTTDALSRAQTLIEAGADILDIGGESTRPGAKPVPVQTEIDRVVPVIEELAGTECLLSVDTRKAAVAREALAAGADIVNDVSGLDDPAMAGVVAEYDAMVVVMDSNETPVDPTTTVEYDDVVSDTIDALRERVFRAEKAGLDRKQIIVDPGLGFGKSAAENFELLGRANEFHALGCPVLIGHSHKSMFELIGHGPDERHIPTVAASTIAAERGADIVRVHDAEATVAAIKTQQATRR